MHRDHETDKFSCFKRGYSRLSGIFAMLHNSIITTSFFSQ